METRVGVVSDLRRFPVKSMLGEQPRELQLGVAGVVGDRRYALVDEETGKVVSVKRPARWGRIFELAAAIQGDDVEITFPDGSTGIVGDPDLPARLSAFLGRAVTIADTPPPDASFDEVWRRELKDGADPYFDLPTRVEDGEELVDGGQFMTAQGSFVNFGAVHIVTTGTSRRLAEVAPSSRFDPHRFRPNLVVETDEDGFVETQWQGRTVQIGDDLQLAISFTVPRCVMTTLGQGDLPADTEVLRTITALNSVDPFGAGTAYPCVGVYADVTRPGAVFAGDDVLLLG